LLLSKYVPFALFVREYYIRINKGFFKFVVFADFSCGVKKRGFFTTGVAFLPQLYELYSKVYI